VPPVFGERRPALVAVNVDHEQPAAGGNADVRIRPSRPPAPDLFRVGGRSFEAV
jgi:hypothetical protein